MRRLLALVCLVTGLGLQALPAFAEDPVAVKLDLFDGDKYSHAFSEALRTAVAGDDRYVISDPLPAEGITVIMKDAIRSDSDNDSELASYSVDIKLGSGKFVATASGFCAVARFPMCGRVVAEDVYNAYRDYLKRTKS